MWLYYLLKSMSWIISHLPYKLVVKIGLGLGRLYYIIAKKQRIRAEETIKERLGYSDEQAKKTIHSLFVKLGATFMEIMYMPALNKDNIRGLVSFDRPEVLWEALGEGKGVVMLACHMDNWEWLGAALALNGFPLSAVEKPQPNHIYSDFMNELRTGVGQEIFSRYYENTGDRKADDYKVTLKMTQIVEEVIKEYPDNWLWFQHRWNTPYTPPEEKELKQGEE